MTDSLRGKACIVGIGETAHRRSWPGRTSYGICAEAAREAIDDAGLKLEDIDGLITFGATVYPGPMAEWIGIKPIHYAAGLGNMGSSAGLGLMTAASIVAHGIANYVLWVSGGARDPTRTDLMGLAGLTETYMMGTSTASEFEAPYGPTVAAQNPYGWLYTRHMHEYGTKEELFHIAVNQRYNAMNNPRSAFREAGLITLDDVRNSRYTNWPLHLLESVMPVAGAPCFIVTTAERAKALRKEPVYLLGTGFMQNYSNIWMNPRPLEAPSRWSAWEAYRMSGYGPMDMQFTQFYD
jgi:acetyl-CoA acetyltransferase